MHFSLPRSIRSCFGTYFFMFQLRPFKLQEYHSKINVVRMHTQLWWILNSRFALEHRCIFTALLYLSELDDFVHGPDGDDPTQAFRYRNAPNALEYTMIHLTGDFPLIDYTLWGRIVCFLIVFAAVGVTSVPQGLIANGFTETLEETRSKTRRRKVIASITIQRMLRGFVQRRTCVVRGYYSLDVF